MFAAYAARSAREIELQALVLLAALAQNLHTTICRSFTERSSALRAKLCGGSKSAKRGVSVPVRRCRRSLTSRPAMPASGSSGVRRARRSTIRLFQDSRCARMRGCNSHIGVTQPDPACLQHMQRGPHARSSCRRWPRLQRSPAISTRSAAHLLNAHQLFVQNFAADRDREKGVIAVLIVPPARQGACPCGG